MKTPSAQLPRGSRTTWASRPQSIRATPLPDEPKLPHREFKLAKWVDEYVGEAMSGWAVRLPSDQKLVRDAVHGYQLLAPHEVAILDTPVIQRLRRIHQTALAYFVYPSAVHSRFDHVLGVAAMANGLWRGLGACGQRLSGTPSPMRMRLAALVHDSGHIFMSHLGETAAGLVFEADVQEAKEGSSGLFEAKDLGEMLSYLIVTSPALHDAMSEALKANKIDGVPPEQVGGLALGKSADPQFQYQTHMISVPFDPTKLA